MCCCHARNYIHLDPAPVAGNSGESSFRGLEGKRRKNVLFVVFIFCFFSFVLYCSLFSKLIRCRLHRAVVSCWDAGLTGKVQEEQRGCALTCQFPHVPTQHHIHASRAGGRTGCQGSSAAPEGCSTGGGVPACKNFNSNPCLSVIMRKYLYFNALLPKTISGSL